MSFRETAQLHETSQMVTINPPNDWPLKFSHLFLSMVYPCLCVWFCLCHCLTRETRQSGLINGWPFCYSVLLSLCLISFLSLCWFCLYHCLCHERRQLGSINPPNDWPLKVSPLRLKVNWPQIRGDVHCQYSWYSKNI